MNNIEKDVVSVMRYLSGGKRRLHIFISTDNKQALDWEVEPNGAYSRTEWDTNGEEKGTVWYYNEVSNDD